MKWTLLCAAFAFALGSAYPASAQTRLDEIVGYTAIVSTKMNGNITGATNNVIVELMNGMMFKLLSYTYVYVYYPSVVVFARRIPPDELAKRGIKDNAGDGAILYKLFIDDKFHDAIRIR